MICLHVFCMSHNLQLTTRFICMDQCLSPFQNHQWIDRLSIPSHPCTRVSSQYQICWLQCTHYSEVPNLFYQHSFFPSTIVKWIGYQRNRNAGHLVLLSICCINMLIIKHSILYLLAAICYYYACMTGECLI